MRFRSALLCGVVLCGSMLTDTAFAQADAAADEGTAIIVTGSRIRRDPLDQDKPIVTVDSEAIA